MPEKNDDTFVLPTLNLLVLIDEAIQREIDSDVTGTKQRVFDYYNSPSKPLTHREFIQFWASMTRDDMAKYYAHFFR